MIAQETIDRIIETARIEDVVGDFLTLKKRGSGYVACCPFHNEKTPSFHVTPSRNIYKCFGCGKAGGAVNFVMEHEHYSYVEALRYLAAKYNIEIQEKEMDAAEIARRQHTESLFLVMDFAQKFFTESLQSPEGRNLGYAYCRSRGLSDETIGSFGIGWAPSARTALTDAARKAGYKDEYLLEAGLSIQREDGSLVDKFRERVMFPIWNVSGRIIAYSGRTLKSDPNIAKYVNSPETELYVKGKTLFGLYLAKQEISRKDKCYLVEGNVDVVSMHQIGVRNTVASCGTALTAQQVQLIKRFTNNLTIMYDGDSAGIHAAFKAVNLALAEDMNVRVVLFPDGDDPDSFSRKHTLAELEDFIASGEKDFISFSIGVNGDGLNDPIKRTGYISDMVESIALIPDPVKRSVYAEEVARRFHVEASGLFANVATAVARNSRDARISRERAEAQSVQSLDNAVVAVKETRGEFPVERDILYFILTYGCDLLKFPEGSKYYRPKGEEFTVADFIDSFLKSDNMTMSDAVYAAAYDAYYDEYYNGAAQNDIIGKLINSQDTVMAKAVADITAPGYELSVRSFKESMMTRDTLLTTNIPKLLLKYCECRIRYTIKLLDRELLQPEADTDAILARIVSEQNKLRKILSTIEKENR